MKNLLSLMLAALMAALVLCSCSAKKNADSSNGSEGGDGASAVESAEETAENPLFTWKIKIDGVEYTLPFDYSEAAANGFTFDSSKDMELGSRTYALFSPQLIKGDDHFSVQFWNPTSEKAASLADCKIGQVSFRAANPIEVVLPGGLVFDETVTVQTILDKYGEPERINEQEDYTSITYKEGVYNTVSFMFYTKDASEARLNEVTLQNLV